jgi:L-seryl-tRNA(Ser) seleniumtransferase
MLAEPGKSVARRARALARRLKDVAARFSVRDGVSRVGGGALPLHDIPTALLAMEADGLSAQALEGRLRSGEPPIVGRIVDDRFCLDLRTVLPGEMKELEGRQW